MVSEPEPSFVPYRVVYSTRVREELKALLISAVRRGLGRTALDTAKEIDRRLRVYPQFGEPLRDLRTPGQTVWAGDIGPLFVQYIIDETNRLVFVVVPIKLLRHSGLEDESSGNA